MEPLQIAVAIINGLLVVGVGALGWWNNRLVARIDVQASQIAKLETAHQVHKTETTGLLSENRLREILKDELKTVAATLDKSQAQMEARIEGKRERLERVEERVSKLEIRWEVAQARQAGQNPERGEG